MEFIKSFVNKILNVCIRLVVLHFPGFSGLNSKMKCDLLHLCASRCNGNCTSLSSRIYWPCVKLNLQCQNLSGDPELPLSISSVGGGALRGFHSFLSLLPGVTSLRSKPVLQDANLPPNGGNPRGFLHQNIDS